ncbi:MAG TPA: tetrahydrofolate dehydrogenase/cyclohydrolase catalytic domain-containing protein, partial [Flavobacteriales bacterium]|nr:tetrahydrofolate dehydrogenase/cyclohydrolase catalytic domain-containing protein [Flavobacteriales bacterium]
MTTLSTFRELNGIECGKAVRARIAEAAALVKSKRGHAPHLAAVLVGDDPASQTYVGSKVKACEEVGFRSSLLKRPADIAEADLLRLVDQLNNDPQVDGFIVQLPLPKHINEERITLAIAPGKDVDGFHPQNLGRMMLGLPGYLPATPNGILELLKHYEVPTEGKHCVVVGRSNIVGTPMAILMSRNTYPGNCT